MPEFYITDDSRGHRHYFNLDHIVEVAYYPVGSRTRPNEEDELVIYMISGRESPPFQGKDARRIRADLDILLGRAKLIPPVTAGKVG